MSSSMPINPAEAQKDPVAQAIAADDQTIAELRADLAQKDQVIANLRAERAKHEWCRCANGECCQSPDLDHPARDRTPPPSRAELAEVDWDWIARSHSN
jgi:hypothetical protein